MVELQFSKLMVVDSSSTTRSNIHMAVWRNWLYAPALGAGGFTSVQVQVLSLLPFTHENRRLDDD